MSLALLVETPPTLGKEAVVPVAPAGRDRLGSHGDAVLAPETPNAMIDASSVAPVSVTEMTDELNGDEAMAYQTSASEKGEALIEPLDLFAKVNPVAETPLTVRKIPLPVSSFETKTTTTSLEIAVVRVAEPELVPVVHGAV